MTRLEAGNRSARLGAVGKSAEPVVSGRGKELDTGDWRVKQKGSHKSAKPGADSKSA